MKLFVLLFVCALPLILNSAPAPRQFRFREPLLRDYVAEAPADSARAAWVKARDSRGVEVEFGARVVLQTDSRASAQNILRATSLKNTTEVAPNVFLLDAPSAWAAMLEAERLASLPGVRASHCIQRRSLELHGPYFARPNDPYFSFVWPLENRDVNGSPGVDINVRAAWPFARGARTTIAVADLGVELTHPELQPRASNSLHFNFSTLTTNGTPFGTNASWVHGTEVAGLALATLNNSRGMSGVAPEAQLASWVIFASNQAAISDDRLMLMYPYQSNIVTVENHSWGNPGTRQTHFTLLEDIGISNAITFGRGGKGVVMVRSAGNDRVPGADANDDGYTSDPRVITTAAVRIDGRAATYSEPGACVLVAAPSGDAAAGFPLVFTTDLVGVRGANAGFFFPPNQDLNDYVFNSLGFSGTSASAPLISGIAALVLSANTNLTYRDVQQILLHSARHFDAADPDLTTTGAGFLVSHNDGFGIPDAGVAVRLALTWSNRPPLTNITTTAANAAAIPDDGLRLLASGEGLPPNLQSIRTAVSFGPQPDAPTALLPLVYVGLATNVLTTNLTGKAALIQRGTNEFADKITKAAQAGAAFAVIFNNGTGSASCGGGDNVCPMAGTDYVPIPAIFIGQTGGEALRNLLQQGSNILAQLRLNPTNYSFTITNTLICEHVGVRVQTDHPLRGDVRITLLSPQGTRSVLQHFNGDTNAGPVDWTYYSVHHFYESSAGTWRVEISDESLNSTGSVQLVQLNILGVPIVDTDADGLDDNWELARFGSLAMGPKDDPDADGYLNAREQIMGTNPNSAPPLVVDYSPWNASLSRLSWPASGNWNYEVYCTTNLNVPFTVATNLSGRFPETEWFTLRTNTQQRFYYVKRIAKP